jgi:hypothetical protein
MIEIGISAPISQLAAGAGPPPIHWIKAIADTGCSLTSIHASVANKCGLKVISKANSNTAASMVVVNLYHGDLLLRPLIGSRPFEWRMNDRRILQLVHSSPDFDALLGMDVLSTGLFSCNGALKHATFCW